MSNVYVMKNELGLVKIGKSKNPLSRRRALRLASGLSVEIERVFEFNNAHAVEQAAHILLAAHRRSGEWFDVSVEDAIEAVKQAEIELSQPIVHYTKSKKRFAPLSMRLNTDWLRWFEAWLNAQTPRPSKASVIRAGVEMFIASSTPHSRAPITKSKTRPSALMGVHVSKNRDQEEK